ncbi:hypothetical protein CI610_02172 [invertebrate metagenome]|uniref:Uncharacterized protein n=1 Tax=invertebrate metagenome TaxID=1711999 RepID=A0A2H9T6Q3_9ZZZZ
MTYPIGSSDSNNMATPALETESEEAVVVSEETSEESGISAGLGSTEEILQIDEVVEASDTEGDEIVELEPPSPGRPDIEGEVFSRMVDNSLDALKQLNSLDANIDLEVINPFDGALILSRVRGMVSEFSALLGTQTVEQSYDVRTETQADRLSAANTLKMLRQEAAIKAADRDNKEGLRGLRHTEKDEKSLLKTQKQDLLTGSGEDSELEEEIRLLDSDVATLQSEIDTLDEELAAIGEQLAENQSQQVASQEKMDAVSEEFSRFRNGNLMNAIKVQFGKGSALEGTGEQSVEAVEREGAHQLAQLIRENRQLIRQKKQQLQLEKETFDRQQPLQDALRSQVSLSTPGGLDVLVKALEKRGADLTQENNESVQQKPVFSNDTRSFNEPADAFDRERLVIALLADDRIADLPDSLDADKPSVMQSLAKDSFSLDEFSRQLAEKMLADSLMSRISILPDSLFEATEDRKMVQGLESLLGAEKLGDLKQTMVTQLREERRSQDELGFIRNRMKG